VYVRIPHRGPVASRNVGAELATGELVHVVDHDDRIAADFYTRILAAYDAGGRRASVLHGLATYVDRQGVEFGPRMPPAVPDYRRDTGRCSS
jgi:glycosyltransferase involved in cell wall biosynthesis